MKQYPRFRGPSLILLAVVHILIFAAGLVSVAMLRHGAPYINPYAPADAIKSFLLGTRPLLASAISRFSVPPFPWEFSRSLSSADCDTSESVPPAPISRYSAA